MNKQLLELRQRGYRLTPQRVWLLETLDQGAGHMTAEQIHAEVVKHSPYINIATVYRNLQWLHENHLVRKIDLGDGHMQWEAASHGVHHHLICERCKEVQVIDNHVVGCLSDHVMEHYGFVVNLDHLAIWGLCTECQGETQTHTEE